MSRLSDKELQEVLDSYGGLGLTIGSVKEQEIRLAFNQRVKDNHPDSTTDPVLKRLFEDKLKEYIHFRDICLKTCANETLNEQVNSYKVRKKITATVSAYYNKTRPFRYAFGVFIFFYGMYYFLDVKSFLFKKDVPGISSRTNQALEPTDPLFSEESPGISSSDEVASSSSIPLPSIHDEDLYPEGQSYVVKYAYSKMGLTIKEKPSFDSKTITVLPYGTKFTAKMTKRVAMLNNTSANWYYLKEADGFVLGEYLVGTEPDESFPLELIEDNTKDIYTTNLKIAYGSHVLTLVKNKAYYYSSKSDKEPVQIGFYSIKKDEIHIALDNEDINLKYKSINEYTILSVKY